MQLSIMQKKSAHFRALLIKVRGNIQSAGKSY